MHYEIYTRVSDYQTEKMMAVLLEKSIPFVEVRLAEQDANALEAKHGRALPFALRKGKLVGGFSDLVNDLRHPRQAPVAVQAW